MVLCLIRGVTKSRMQGRHGHAVVSGPLGDDGLVFTVFVSLHLLQNKHQNVLVLFHAAGEVLEKAENSPGTPFWLFTDSISTNRPMFALFSCCLESTLKHCMTLLRHLGNSIHT